MRPGQEQLWDKLMSEGFEQQLSMGFSGQLPGRHEQPIKDGLEKAGTISRLRTANAPISLMIFTNYLCSQVITIVNSL